eukprot:15226441-Ditylum_brightwellii.AAC.1
MVELRTHHLDNGAMAILAYINDASVVLRHANVLWLFETIEALGEEFGCKMNIDKNKILATTTGASILPYINNNKTRDNLEEAINRYTTGETTDCITILGFPMGSLEYTNCKLCKFTSDLEQDATTIVTFLPDTQTATQIYHQCQLQRAPFRMTADVMANGP